jgi:hypothetical protein
MLWEYLNGIGIMGKFPWIYGDRLKVVGGCQIKIVQIVDGHGNLEIRTWIFGWENLPTQMKMLPYETALPPSIL